MSLACIDSFLQRRNNQGIQQAIKLYLKKKYKKMILYIKDNMLKYDLPAAMER